MEQTATGVSQQAQQAFEDATAQMQQGIGQTLSDGIFNAVQAGLSGKGLGGVFKALGGTLLAGLGDVITQFGKALIAFGVTASALRIGLSNPFTAGPAGIAIGAALVALGGTFSKIASGGSPARGTAGAGAFREPRFPATATSDIVTRTVSFGTGQPMPQPAIAVSIGPIIGANDPIAQRAIMKLVQNAQHRGIR